MGLSRKRKELDIRDEVDFADDLRQPLPLRRVAEQTQA